MRCACSFLSTTSALDHQHSIFLRRRMARCKPPPPTKSVPSATVWIMLSKMLRHKLRLLLQQHLRYMQFLELDNNVTCLSNCKIRRTHPGTGGVNFLHARRLPDLFSNQFCQLVAG